MCNFEQTAAVRFRYAALFLGSKGVHCRVAPEGDGSENLWRCGVLLSPRALSRTASLLHGILRLAQRLRGSKTRFPE